MAEAFLSASVEVLLDRLISLEFVNFIRSKKLDVSLLDKLQTTLLSLQAVLNDAEEKQITNHAVKEWLYKLRDAVFEAEDLLDEINTKALQSKVKAKYQSQTVSTKVRNFVSSPFKRSYGVINTKMEKLFERLEHFAQKGHFLGLKEGVSGSVWKGTPTSSVVDESAIYGRDDDRKILKDYLLSENDANDSGSKIGVISIVGMGGLGKSTLAKLLYNDPEVKEKFNLKGWAYISKDFDVCRVTKTLLECVSSKTIDINNQNSLHPKSITLKRTDTNNLNTLQMQLQQSLSHKRFLLVLDDIWDGNYIDWNNLKDIFNAGEMGSKIIITTRDERVALAMQTFLPIHYLTPLQSEDCWSLLAKHAFGAINYRERSNLEVIGKEIAKKCDGLPLAAVTLGGLLRTKLSQDWNKVLKSNMWDLPNVEVQPSLLLSYHYLPSPLKRCFAYCSIFPKNSKLEKETVVQLWMAEGLVHHSKSQKSMEEVGDEYFDELVSRSLIRRQFVDGEANFVMHDLINDLATQVSSAYCVRLDEQMPHETVRHLSYNRGVYDSLNKFDPLFGLKVLRTFLGLPLGKPQWRFISNKVIENLLSEMKQLRVLSLTNYKNISVLSNSIGNLIHLRYLNLSHTNIERLPSVICKLCNLQTLLLSNCGDLTELPKEMEKLVSLRHLDVSGSHLQEMPAQIAELQNLQTLSDFIVSKQDDGLKVAELRKFPHLQGKLRISKLQNVTDPSDAFQANLKMKERISVLELEWGMPHVVVDFPEVETLVIEQLQPSKNLNNLTISRYSGRRFPNWLGDSSFGQMVYLKIKHNSFCSSLPPLGQLPCLKELHIAEMYAVKTIGVEFYGSCSPSFQPFPLLEKLTFENMRKWEEWNLNGGTTVEFPSLRYLSFSSCPKLKGNIPKNLPSLTALTVSRCPLLESRHSDDNTNIIKPSDLFSQFQFPLRKLYIDSIPSLKSFPRDGLPKTLQSLSIRYCENLEFLPHESLSNCASLEELEILDSCYSMTSFALGSLPVLKILSLASCKNLKSIFVAEHASKSLSFLRYIEISDCDELESLCPDGLPTPNLIYFCVYRCNKLPSLPESFNTLAGLQTLTIVELPNLQSFAKEGLPTNLRDLSIGNVGGINGWGLERLTGLLYLKIEGDDLVEALMKMEVSLLPVSLVGLEISNLDHIECLEGKWLQHLTCLESLEISNSSNLKSLPEEGLPSSLSELTIGHCQYLDACLMKKRGKEWLKIAHIPLVVVNLEVIKSRATR